MNRIRLSLAAGLLVGALAGCGNRQAEQTQKEKVVQQWAEARAGVQFAMAKQQFEAGDLDKARQTVDDCLKIDPKYTAALILSGKLAIEKGQLELAERS